MPAIIRRNSLLSRLLSKNMKNQNTQNYNSAHYANAKQYHNKGRAQFECAWEYRAEKNAGSHRSKEEGAWRRLRTEVL
jgi:hypothetical protein